MSTVAVTGASGKTGRGVLVDLLANGYDVRAIDSSGGPGDRGELAELGAPLLRADLTDYGQTIDALDGVDSVIHLAAIPAPGFFTDAHTFTANTAMNSNVFFAAAKLKLDRVVWSSSETTLGLPFEDPPRYVPMDEDHYPIPTTTYALSKVVGETLAGHISEWSGIPFIALRLSNVYDASDYAKVPTFWDDPRARMFNLWGYIDVRDVALACRLALGADVAGALSYVIAARDTVMNRPSAELMQAVFPGVPIRDSLGPYDSLHDSGRARTDLGFVAQHSWRDIISES